MQVQVHALQTRVLTISKEENTSSERSYAYIYIIYIRNALGGVGALLIARRLIYQSLTEEHGIVDAVPLSPAIGVPEKSGFGIDHTRVRSRMETTVGGG